MTETHREVWQNHLGRYSVLCAFHPLLSASQNCLQRYEDSLEYGFIKNVTLAEKCE